jgi:hypothetical protein|nr:MAG TPA: hypothetical protein [Bacteriophage sp.]
MKFVNRGGTSVLSAIREGAKHVSEQNGIATMKLVDDSAVKHSIEEAFGVMPNSTNTMSSQTPFTNSVTPQSTINPRVEGKSGVNVSNAFEDKLVNKLQKCIETLADTGEYYNAVDALFTLHTMGALTDGVVDSITRRDLKEIKSIVKEFKDIVDSF